MNIYLHFAAGFTMLKMESSLKQGLIDQISSTTCYFSNIAACRPVLYGELLALDTSALVVRKFEVTLRLYKMVHYLYHGVPVGRVVEIESDAL